MFIISPLPDMRDVGALGAPQRGAREAHEDGGRDEGVVGGVELRDDVGRVAEHGGDDGPLGRQLAGSLFNDAVRFHGRLEFPHTPSLFKYFTKQNNNRISRH